MLKLRYGLCSPIRSLLPLSMGLFIVPILFLDTANNYIYLPVAYFFAMYFWLINFPSICESLHKTPIYFEDLQLARKEHTDHTFQRAYNAAMSFILALIFAGVADYVIIQGVTGKDPAEVTAIIGGNAFLFMKIQNEAGRVLLTVCHAAKENEKNTKNTRRFTSYYRGNGIRISCQWPY